MPEMRHFLFIDEETIELHRDNDNDERELCFDMATVLEIGSVIYAIAEKGWKPKQPRLADSPLLVQRASMGLYTLLDVEKLYEYLNETQELPPFSSMTTECFIAALDIYLTERRAA